MFWPDKTRDNSTKQLKEIETKVRNLLHCLHVYHVPQGKGEEEINKVTAQGGSIHGKGVVVIGTRNEEG